MEFEWLADVQLRALRDLKQMNKYLFTRAVG
jgi:hypothetical protein